MSTHKNLSQNLALKIKTLVEGPKVLPIYFFSGNISYNSMNSHLIELKSYLKFSVSKTQTRKRVYSILVEGLDNIYRHGYFIYDKDFNKYTFGYLLIANVDDKIVIWFGNYIENKNVDSHKLRLDGILKKSKKDLSNSIKNNILDRKLADYNSAGIGLMDIMRKIVGDGVISYYLDKYNNDLSVFTLEIKIT